MRSLLLSSLTRSCRVAALTGVRGFGGMGLDEPTKFEPYFAKGEVVKGFGRGSKELGIPTANFPESVVDSLPESFKTGVYFGWAQVDQGPVYKMVMSIGWNPYYKNTKKSMETHVMHVFDQDFYGSLLRVIITGYIRGERDFDSLDALITEIKNDISVAESRLQEPAMQELSKHEFFSRDEVKTSV